MKLPALESTRSQTPLNLELWKAVPSALEQLAAKNQLPITTAINQDEFSQKLSGRSTKREASVNSMAVPDEFDGIVSISSDSDFDDDQNKRINLYAKDGYLVEEKVSSENSQTLPMTSSLFKFVPEKSKRMAGPKPAFQSAVEVEDKR